MGSRQKSPDRQTLNHKCPIHSRRRGGGADDALHCQGHRYSYPTGVEEVSLAKQNNGIKKSDLQFDGVDGKQHSGKCEQKDVYFVVYGPWVYQGIDEVLCIWP